MKLRRYENPKNKKSRRVYAISMLVAVIFLAVGVLCWTRNHQDQQAPLPATLNVTSHPDGAQVYLGGELKGCTPLEFDLDLGKYDLRISLPNYHAWEAQVRLIKRGEMPLFVRLVPKE